MSTRRIVFVCHTAAGESLRSARAVAKLTDVELLGISQGPASGDLFEEMRSVSDVHDAEQLIEAAKAYGGLNKFVLGQELCFDTITIDNEPQFYTLCEYNPRSEEHTSELQSPYVISYAV